MPVHSPFLKYFNEVCEAGSIRLAARRLYVASSAVNRQILKVENELGVKLFERRHDGIVLTPAGELLARHVRNTLKDAELTLNEITALGGDQHLVTIAGQESVIASFLPPALVQLHAELPDISTAFKAAGGPQLHDLLSAGDADIALAFDAEPRPDIEQIALIQLQVGAVAGRSHPLSRRKRITLANCAKYPIVLPDASWPLRRLLDREIARAGLHFNIITSSNSAEFLKNMVDQQLCVGFQTIVGIESKVTSGDFVHIPLHADAPIMQTLSICVRSDRAVNPVLERVLELLVARLTEYV